MRLINIAPVNNRNNDFIPYFWLQLLAMHTNRCLGFKDLEI